MVLPNLKKYGDGSFSKAITDKSIVVFKGINFQPVIGEGEFSDMTNLSARNYPCLSPRAQRTVHVDSVSDMTSFIACGSKMAWVRSNTFYYDGASKGALKAEFAEATRQLVVFQDRIIIWPDKMYYDITDNVLGNLAVSISKTGLVFSASELDANLGNSVKYATITSSTSLTGLNAGDSIQVSGCTISASNNKYAVIDHISADGKDLYFAENTFGAATETSSVTISRPVPDMDYICVANNRLWGCKATTIYGSKLGSAENWYNFAGISTDSYAVDVASPGDFTGCHAYGSYVVFFKEDSIHKLLGTKPTNFQLSTITCPAMGLQGGCIKSVAYISGLLYFKSKLGIVAFTGGAPSLESECFSYTNYTGGVACTDGRCYYVSMTDGTAYSLFVLDTFHRVWHREDATQVKDFGVISGTVYMLAGGNIVKLNDKLDNQLVTWSGVLGEFTEFAAEKKIHSKIRMRVELPTGSTLKVEYSADGGGWVTAWTGSGSKREAFFASIVPIRCDSFRLRLSGTGDCKIYQLDRVFSYGSDVG